MNFKIPYAKQDINQDDIDAVVAALKSDWLTQGPMIEAFENACARYVNVNHALAVNNATSALHLACLALDLKQNDILWTSPITFAASSNCALYCGAKIDFVDIDKKTYNISVEALEEKLHGAFKLNKLPKILIAVHFAGQSCEMARIKALADQYGIKIIEDGSQAIGGKYLNQSIGSCEFSDVAVFSFHPVKIITTGEGGMVLTNNETIKNKVALLRTHGITRDPHLIEGKSEGAWYCQQIELGHNYRMTDFQAALGLSQLKRIELFIQRRHVLALQYQEALSDLPVILPWQSRDCHSAFHLYVIQLKLTELNRTRGEIFDSLRAAGIGVNVHHIPVHLHPYYRRLGFNYGSFPIAEAYYERAISLPMYAALKDVEQKYVVETLRKILNS